MERLEMMIDKIESVLHQKMASGIESINTDELFKATDILKDLYMCCYYKSVIDSMNSGDMQAAMEEAGLVRPNVRM